jgi:hypothetical protein
VGLVPRLAHSHDPEIAAEFVAWMRKRIDPVRVEWTRAIFLALGALDEGESMPELIAALDFEGLCLRESALRALRSISGLAMPADSKRWEAWYSDEIEWFLQSRPDLAAALASATPSSILPALRAYSEHTLHRSILARDVVILLEHPNADIRILACETLGRFRSRAGLNDLLDALLDPDAAVADAARAALERIVGEPVPASPQAARARILPGT